VGFLVEGVLGVIGALFHALADVFARLIELFAGVFHRAILFTARQGEQEDQGQSFQKCAFHSASPFVRYKSIGGSTGSTTAMTTAQRLYGWTLIAANRFHTWRPWWRAVPAPLKSSARSPCFFSVLCMIKHPPSLQNGRAHV